MLDRCWSPVSNVASSLRRGILIGLGLDEGDDLAADEVHPLQPLQGQVAAEEPVAP